MKAEVGDQTVVASGTLHRPIRDGEILQIGADGGGPYLVRWSDSGNESLFFLARTPMSSMSSGRAATLADSRVQQHRVPSRRRGGQLTSTSTRTKARTSANAVLHSDVPAPLDVRGEARRSPADPDMPVVGDEVAAARALRHLADRLLEMASSDLSDAEGILFLYEQLNLFRALRSRGAALGHRLGRWRPWRPQVVVCQFPPDHTR